MSDTEPTYDGITARAIEQLRQATLVAQSSASVLGCEVRGVTTYTVPSRRKLDAIAKAVNRPVRLHKFAGSEVAVVKYPDIEFQTFTGRCD